MIQSTKKPWFYWEFFLIPNSALCFWRSVRDIGLNFDNIKLDNNYIPIFFSFFFFFFYSPTYLGNFWQPNIWRLKKAYAHYTNLYFYHISILLQTFNNILSAERHFFTRRIRDPLTEIIWIKGGAFQLHFKLYIVTY